MRKATLRALCVLMAVWAFASCIYAQQGDKERIKVGDTLPQFELRSSVYGDVNSAQLKGKVILVCLFATWCPPCQQELADVQGKLYPQYKDNADFRLLVIGREHTDEQLSAYNEKKKFAFPLYPDPKRRVFNLFADTSIPRAYLFGKDGKLIKASLGYTKAEFNEMMKEIEKALK